jgi:hypothetical protein
MIGSAFDQGWVPHCKDLFRTQLTLRGSPISDCVGYEDEQVNYRDRTAAAAYGAWNPAVSPRMPTSEWSGRTACRVQMIVLLAAR